MQPTKTRPHSLGLVASGKRSIQPGKEYEKFFNLSQLQKADPVLSRNGSTFDTIVYMERIVQDTLPQTARIAKELKAGNLETSLRKIWSFVYNHFQYSQDDPAEEQLRSPIRSWVDRKEGIDCDCMSIFISSVLSNLGIAHTLRKTKYGGKDYFQHIYIVVPKKPGTSLSSRQNYYVLDCVVDKFDYEVPFSEKHDKPMQIRHLNGLDTATLNGGISMQLSGLLECDCRSQVLGLEFESLGELPGVEYGDEAIALDFLIRMKKHLHNTRMAVAANPELYREMVGSPQVFLSRLDYALMNFDDPHRRDKVLDELAAMEDTQPMGSLGSLEGWGFFKKIGSGIKKVTGAVKKGVKKAGRWVGKTANKAAKGIKKTAKKTWSKVKDIAKDVGKAVVKYNPATIAIRNGVLLGLKTNIMRISEKLGYALWSESEARRKGLDMNFHREVKKKYAKALNMHTKLGGQKDSFDKNLKQGWERGTKKRGSLRGLGEPVTAAAIIAAATPVLAAIAALVSHLTAPKKKEVSNPSPTPGPNPQPASTPQGSSPNPTGTYMQPAGGGAPASTTPGMPAPGSASIESTSSNNMPLILGGAAAVTAGILWYLNQ